MRINVYSQELTDEVIEIERESNTGRVYRAAQLILHSSERLHHPPMDDDRSAVTFWLPSSVDRREAMAQAFEQIAAIFRRYEWEEPETPQEPEAQPMTREEKLAALRCRCPHCVAYMETQKLRRDIA